MTDELIVIGGGPAGVACALWAHQLGLHVRLLEAASAIGGLLLITPYENRWMPGLQGKTGQDIAASLRAHLDTAGVPYEINFDAVSLHRSEGSGCWQVSNGSKTHQAPYVVIATGSKPRSGGFVESENVGIGPGATMERINVLGRRMAILGGGDNAFDNAILALRRGAQSVDIYARHAPRAQPALQREISPGHVFIGDFVANQSRMTVNDVPYDVISVQFGYEASIPAGLKLSQRDGYIDVDQRGAVPGVPGLYSAGEVTNYWHPCVVTSYAHGVQVAKSIQAEILAYSAISTGN